MFGPKMRVEFDGFGVTLRPFGEADLPQIVEGFSSMRVMMFTKQLFAQTLESEKEWYENARKSKEDVGWAIVPDGSEVAVGTTGIHHIRPGSHTCGTGIVIWKPELWGRGIGSRAHLARTLYAADFLQRLTINSSVRLANEASRRALEKVGYNVTGITPRSGYRRGRYLDTYTLTWFHPERISVLYPEGLPEEYQAGVERAQVALEKARQVVEFL